MTIDQTIARTVRNLDERIPDPAPRRRGPVEVHEVLALLDALKDSGYSAGAQAERLDAINTAVEQMLASNVTRWLDGIDLMTSDVADITEAIRQAGIDRAAQAEIGNMVRRGLQPQLARAASDDIQANSDRVIGEMRKRWEPAVKAVQTAAAEGLTQHTDSAYLLDRGSAAALEAYRALGPAVTELDRIAGLRNRLTTIAGVGPDEWPTAAFITAVQSGTELEGAELIWSGESEVVQHETQMRGAHLAHIRRQRLGGAWLSLIVAGYTLRLNTGAEAHAVVRSAMNGDAE